MLRTCDKTIFIITDNRDTYSDLAEHLTFEGFGVAFLPDKNTRLQKIIESVPDFIICDMYLNGQDSMEILQTLQKIDFTASIPFVLAGPPKKYSCIYELKLLGALDYILIPFEISDILITIKREFNKKDFLVRSVAERYTILLQNPFTGIFILHNHTFFFCNKAFSKILGYSADELYNLSLPDIIYSPDFVQFTDIVEKYRKNNISSFQTRIRAITKNQNIVNLNLWGNLYCENAVCKLTAMAQPADLTNSSVISDKPAPSPLDPLSKREKEILILICQGYTSQEIAEIVYLSERTVQGHRASLLEKTGSKNTASLISFAIHNGYFPPRKI